MTAQGRSIGIQCVKTFGQPSSSADSQQTQHSPRVGASAAGFHHSSPDVLCTEHGVGQLDGHSARWQQHGGAHQQAARFPSQAAFTVTNPAVAAAASPLRFGPEDPASAKDVFKQLTSHMSPAALTELQNIIREQRLQRQQQDTFALIAAAAPAGPCVGPPVGPWTPALPSLNPSHIAGPVHQDLNPLDAMRAFGEAAAAFAAALSQQQSCSQIPAHYSTYLPEMISQPVMVPQQCPCQQHHYRPVMPAATAAPAPAAAAASTLRHPGVTSCRAPRSSRSRKPRTAAVCTLPSDTHNPQLQPVLPAAAAAAAAAAVPEAAASPPVEVSPPSPSPPPLVATAAAASDHPCMSDNPSSSSSSLRARFARLSSDVQASVLSQLDDLEASEEERRAAKEARRAAREAAAGNAQRKSSRTRKAKTYEDEEQLRPTSNSRSVSPDPAAAAATDRAGSTDANNSTGIELHTPPPQQQQEVIKKRVRFAFADGDVGGSESDDHVGGKKFRSSSSSTSPQIQGLGGANHCDALCALDGLTVFQLEAEEAAGEYDQAAVERAVRRVGPRAQARKRMHKKTIRRRRPQRAPLC